LAQEWIGHPGPSLRHGLTRRQHVRRQAHGTRGGADSVMQCAVQQMPFTRAREYYDTNRHVGPRLFLPLLVLSF
jgi:hypothetical protein